MSLDRNRMHAVLDEMGRHLEHRLGRRIFKIDTLLAGPREAAHVVAGGVDETRRAALAVQAHRFPPRRTAASTPCDILVYGVPDTSPYAIWASVNPILTLISMGLGYLGGMIDAAGARAAPSSWRPPCATPGTRCITRPTSTSGSACSRRRATRMSPRPSEPRAGRDDRGGGAGADAGLRGGPLQPVRCTACYAGHPRRRCHSAGSRLT